jgi:bifunctional UDP-N-acetylglucosamine pyrophosphorylase/glucosamine-1-phosphate N-acetyltransferase
MALKAIILAAGKGTRMKSEMLKVAHEVAGKPIINHVIDTVKELGVDDIILVIGHQAELIKEITGYANVKYVMQEEQLGTGHAVMQVEPIIDINQNDTIVVLAGDCPLIEASTLQSLLAIHSESNASGTILTTMMDNPANYGRMLRGKMGTVVGIKEAKDCSAEELAIQEINTGIYCFQAKELFYALHQITNQNAQKEYYLTDVIHILKNKGDAISAFCTHNSNEVIGINTRMDLANINRIIMIRIITV